MSDFSDFTDFQIVFTNENINNYLPRPQISFSDFTDFQIVLTNRTINDYLPRPQSSFSDFTDFQPVLGSSLLVRNWSVKQYGISQNCYLLKEVTAGVWESNAKFYVKNISPAVTAIIGTDTFTAQELIDMAAANSTTVTLFWAEDVGVTVDVADYETNVHHLKVITADGDKFIYPSF